MMLAQSHIKTCIPSELRAWLEHEASDAPKWRAKRIAKKERKKRTKEVRAGDWKCRCGANVFAKKNKCFRCGTPKTEGERPCLRM